MTVRNVPHERLAGLSDPGRGLSGQEVADRLSRYGTNDIITAPPETWFDVVRDTLRDPMIWFLVGVSVLFALLGDTVEALVLAAALVPLMGMDAYLHRRTKASTQGLAGRIAAQATVVRDGVPARIPARDLVPGDLAEVMPGEPSPADGLIVAAVDAQVDEAALTGESYPVRKRPVADPFAARAVAMDQWLLAGTRLLAGSVRLRVAYTGGETVYGEIVRSAMAGSHARTPLQAAVMRVVAILLAGALLSCLVLAAIRLAHGHGLKDAALSAVTLAIAALPEEFPVVFTFFLGVGVYRLAHRQALVRRAVAVENIGRVTCICSDKTGTLTEGRLVLSHRLPAPGTTAEDLLAWASLAARAESGDPLDAALIEGVPTPGRSIERLVSFPFTEQRRRETTILRDGGALVAVTKGAPETVFSLCDAPAAAETWRAQVTELAAAGHKVIACATKTLGIAEVPAVEPDDGFKMLGLLAVEDPLRDGVFAAVDECRKAGIRVIMITGDHPATAEAIAREAGLGAGDPIVVLADALAGSEETIATALAGADVVARATPSQKLDIVRALQSAGEIVVVTGDGVNDVPALQMADVGIAMGERGTQSAREVAAIVLLDDNFSTIVHAVAEGRQLFRNLQLAFAYLVMTHIPLVISAAAVPLADYPLLYLPVHIVWLELIIHPTALLVFQELPGGGRLLATSTTSPQFFFGRRAWLVIGATGIAVAALVSFGFAYALGPEGDVAHARSMALALLILASSAITAVLSGARTWTALAVIFGSLASLAVLIQVPSIAELVHLRPLHGLDWLLAAAAASVIGVFAAGVKMSLNAPTRAMYRRVGPPEHR
jgi:Ca2+-transporting ATPase